MTSDKRVLVVEDEPLSREMLIRICRSHGHEVEGAEDGEGAEAGGRRPDAGVEIGAAGGLHLGGAGEEREAELANPDVAKQAGRYQKLAKELGGLAPLVRAGEREL